MLVAPELSTRATKAGLHLIGDKESAVFLHDAHRDLKIALRRHHKSANTLDGLGQEARDLSGGCVLDEVLNVLRTGHSTGVRGQAEVAAVAVRSMSVLHTSNLCRQHPPWRVGRQSLGQHGAARVAVAQSHQLRGSRVGHGEHDSHLIGLCTRAHKKGLLDVAGRLLGERFGHLKNRGCGVEGRDVREVLQLHLDRRVHVFIAVLQRHGQDAPKKVEVVPTVVIGDPHPLCPIDHDRLLVVGEGGRGEKALVALHKIVWHSAFLK